MSKTILMSVAPLLAVAAFAIAPAAASAVTTYGTCASGTHSANCPAGEKYTAFTAVTKVRDKKAAGSGNFILTTAAGTIECTAVFSAGTDENVGTVGHSKDTLIFEGCTTKFETATCKVATGGSKVITGEVTDEVTSETTVKITVTGGFEINFQGNEAGCPPENTEVGTVTGTATGTQAKATNVLVFAAATGLIPMRNQDR